MLPVEGQEQTHQGHQPQTTKEQASPRIGTCLHDSPSHRLNEIPQINSLQAAVQTSRIELSR